MFISLKKSFLPLVLLLLSTALSFAQSSTSTIVSTISEFNVAMKKAAPGSKIILKNGEWNDVHFNVKGIGTKEAPILVTAETDGKVIVSGNSKMNISGKYIIVKGLWFKDGNPTGKEVISFRENSKNFAFNCRLTNCTISYFNPSDPSIENHWVDLWGKNNRVDHNNFTGKINGGTTLVVWLKGQEHTENNHKIDHNFFGNRPDLGENGGETIRIGTSTNSMESSKTIVEYNTFKHCNGEIEIISNKSCDNILRNNLFIESEGTLTLRHGNNALVEGNIFIGNNNPRVGGIRIINKGHIVQNNLMINVIGDDYRAPISIMNGIPNSPLNRYHQVKDVLVQNNTLLNSGSIVFGAGSDSEKTLAPVNVKFINNLISNTDNKAITIEKDDITGIHFSGNIVDSQANINPTQFKKGTINWQLLKNLPVPANNNEILKQVEKIEQSPLKDISQVERTVFVAGAFNLGTTKTPRTLTARSGPFWKPVIEDKTPTQPETSNITAEPGLGTLNKALKKVGKKGTLTLLPGTYIVEKTMKISGNITIEGANMEETIIKSSNEIENGLSYFFRVQEGGNFHLKNLTMDGESDETVKYAIVSPDKNNIGTYNVYVDNCIFQNFTNKDGGAIFKAYTGTFADTISFKNSKLIESYRGLNLSYEKSPLGKVSAKNLLIHNTIFKSLDEFAINYYRNNSNLITKAGNLKVTNCVFSKVFNKEKGYILKADGIEFVTIENSVFENSFNSKTSINLKGINHKITNCLIYNCGDIKALNSNAKQHLIFGNPKWEDRTLFIPSEKSKLLKSNNGKAQIGLIH